MQSVVTGKAPITLVRKIASEEEKNKQKIIHTITETNRIPQAKYYAVGLGGSKRSISDPLFIRRDVSGWLPYLQSDRVCVCFFCCFCAVSGGV